MDLSQVIYCGGYSGGVPPLPIPNREVKPAIADGTAPPGGRVGSCRSSMLARGSLFIAGFAVHKPRTAAAWFSSPPPYPSPGRGAVAPLRCRSSKARQSNQPGLFVYGRPRAGWPANLPLRSIPPTPGGAGPSRSRGHGRLRVCLANLPIFPYPPCFPYRVGGSGSPSHSSYAGQNVL